MSTFDPHSNPQHPNNAENDPEILRLENDLRRLKAEVKELGVLNELAIAASSFMEVDQMLDMIVEKSVQALQAEQGSIKLLTEQEESPLKTLIQVDQRTRVIDFRVGMHITGWVLKQREPLLIENLASDSRFNATPPELEQIKNLLCVPILFKGELLGVLMVVNKKSAEPFNPRDQRLLSIIAAQSGQLIRNRQLQAEALEKERIQQELALARQIQMNLIPKTVPQINNLQIAGFMQTADEVGGDYYDYFTLDENRLGVVIADVSGHGPPAALIMTMVKGILHSITQGINSPGKVLSELNTVLSNIAPPEIFVTMMFLIFDTKNKTLQYSNAGHNPLLYFNPQTASAEFIKFYSPSLNISALSKYTEKELALNSGDVILVYTDGVTEAFNEQGDMLTEGGLLQTVKTAPSLTPDMMIHHINQSVRKFTGGAPQHDDMAMIAVKMG